MSGAGVDVLIRPYGGLAVLSRAEVARLRDASRGDVRALLRSCALAVLSGGYYGDDPRAQRARNPNFAIDVRQDDRGLALQLRDAPADAFVGGEMIRGINELLFAVVRDIVFISTQIEEGRLRTDSPDSITETVFEIARQARLMQARVEPNLVVCWGGHSIGRDEYDYTKHVGYELGLRGLDICTGCGPGAMKGPMKGAAVGHAKQRRDNNRYIGITEPGIIAAESPNPIVNQLMIMPDIEKRLEAFVRLAHGVVVFPGGVGTAEEILYILGILLDPANRAASFPLLLTGPAESADYFAQIDKFLRLALGAGVAEHYRIVNDDPAAVGEAMAAGMRAVKKYRQATRDAFFFNWSLRIDASLQRPFEPTHASIAELELRRDRPPHLLAADLRRVFSAIVAGNLKEQGMREIAEHGPYVINGEPKIMRAMDELLQTFVEQRRMKLEGAYEPCYRVVTKS